VRDLTGQIGLTYTTGFIGRLIQKVTRSRYNHCVLALDNFACIGAEPGGVRVRPITDFRGIVWSKFRFTEAERIRITEFVLAQQGKEYNYADDFFIGVALITKTHTPRWLERRLSSTDSWQCAQLSDAALIHIGINLFDDDRPIGAVYPGSLARRWRKRGWL